MKISRAKLSRLVFVGFYLFAGINHFWHPEFYLPLIPDYLGEKELINTISGLLEISLALGVALPKTRKLALWGVILLLIGFIPSHWYFIEVGGCIENGLCVPIWIAWLRLLLIHPLLILWAWKLIPNYSSSIS